MFLVLVVWFWGLLIWVGGYGFGRFGLGVEFWALGLFGCCCFVVIWFGVCDLLWIAFGLFLVVFTGCCVLGCGCLGVTVSLGWLYFVGLVCCFDFCWFGFCVYCFEFDLGLVGVCGFGFE